MDRSTILVALIHHTAQTPPNEKTYPALVTPDEWHEKDILKKFDNISWNKSIIELHKPENIGNYKKWALLIGPEGGFSESELVFLDTLPFVINVSLGPRILRAETAAVAILSCWQAFNGDWAQRPAD